MIKKNGLTIDDLLDSACYNMVENMVVCGFGMQAESMQRMIDARKMK